MDTEDTLNVDDLTELGYKFSELGEDIAAASRENSRYFDNVVDNLEALKFVTDSLSSETFGKLKNEISSYVMAVPDIVNMYTHSFSNVDNTFTLLNSTATHFKDALGKYGDPSAVSTLPPSSPSSLGSKVKSGDAERKATIIDREIKTAGSLLKGFAGKMKIPLVGGIAAGGMIWAAMGFSRKQRIAAEAGELKNILVSATDAAVKGVLKTATGHLSDLQERLQKEYGIAKGDFQGAVKAFVDGGVEIERALDKVGDGLGEAGKSTLVFTYALDKMFELPGGSSATRAIQMMSEYGYTLDEAREKLTTMMLAGRESGIGMTQFMKNITGAGDDLKKFGFDLETVADLALTLQDRFEELGVPKHFAGRQAALGIQQIASGITGMSMDWQVFIAEKAGYGSGLEGRQKMMSAQQRVARGGSDEDLMKMYATLATVALDIAGGDEVYAKHILEKPMGVGFEGAVAALEILKAINGDDIVSARKLVSEKREELKDSLTTEKQKRNAWELQMNNWLDAVSMVGEGLLSLLATLVAYVMVFGKSALSLIANHLMGKTHENDEILKDLDVFMKENPFKTDILVEGAKKMMDVTQDMGLNVLGEGVKALESAWEFGAGTPGGKGKSDAPTPSKRPVSPFVGKGKAVRQVIQTIVDPSGRSETAAPASPTPRRSETSQGGQVASPNQGWVGGAMSIVSTGADAVGNLGMALVGNCPKCGLAFGKGSVAKQAIQNKAAGIQHSASDVEAMARMLASEVGRKRVGKDKASVQTEAAGIGWTAMNRMLNKQKAGKDASIEDVITNKQGYGKQGYGKKGSGRRRAYSTAREATPESRALAEDILSGEVADPTQGSTHFYHEWNRDYGGGKAIPRFTEGKVNPLNVNKARFFRKKGAGVTDAPDREQRDQKLIQKHAKRHANDPTVE